MLLGSNRLLAQLSPFAVIHDPDGSSNVRGGDKHEVVDRLMTDQVFAVRGVVDGDGWQDWYWIDYPDYSLASQGFEKFIHKTKDGMLHKSRVKAITDLPQWKNSHFPKDSLLVCRHATGNIQLEIAYTRFNVKDHVYSRNVDGAIEKIDGSEPWGIDGYVYDDLTAIKSIRLIAGASIYNFPAQAVKNLLMPTTALRNFGVAEGGAGVLFLYMSNSDGAGSYDVVWTIKDGKCRSQYLYRNF